MNSARLFIVSAPSGCGKGTILHKVFSDDKAFILFHVLHVLREMKMLTALHIIL